MIKKELKKGYEDFIKNRKVKGGKILFNQALKKAVTIKLRDLK